MITTNDTRCSNPIFVVGYGHSGTTLLLKILSNAPSLFALCRETLFFDYLPMLRRRFLDLSNEATLRDFVIYLINIALTGSNYREHLEATGERPVTLDDLDIAEAQVETILGRAKKVCDHGKLFCLVMDNLTEGLGKERWLEKTPSHIFHIDTIVGLMPDARFVELTRDPRDILTSRKVRSSEAWLNQFQGEKRMLRGLRRGFDPFRDTLGWKSAIHAGNEAKRDYPHAIIRVRYEDLVTEPEKELSGVCDFLEIGFRPEMLHVPWRNTTTSSKKNKHGISSDSIGKWQPALPSEAVAVCQWVARAEMDMLGYTRACLPFAARAKIPLSIGKSGFEFLGRLHRRWRLGGFVYLRNFLGNYWHRLQNLARN